MDWGIVAVAIVATRDVQLSKGRRKSVRILMMVGGIGSVISLARLPLIKHWRVAHQSVADHKALPLGLMSMTEVTVTIMAMSAVALRPLFREVKGKSLSSYVRSRRGPGHVRTRSASRLGSLDHGSDGQKRRPSAFDVGDPKESSGVRVVTEVDSHSTTSVLAHSSEMPDGVSTHVYNEDVQMVPLQSQWPAAVYLPELQGREYV